MKASVVIEKDSKFEIVPLPGDKHKLLLLDRTTETGELFRVVAGYFLGERGNYSDGSSLVEIEIVPVAKYGELKAALRNSAAKEEMRRVPITFW